MSPFINNLLLQPLGNNCTSPSGSMETYPLPKDHFASALTHFCTFPAGLLAPRVSTPSNTVLKDVNKSHCDPGTPKNSMPRTLHCLLPNCARCWLALKFDRSVQIHEEALQLNSFLLRARPFRPPLRVGRWGHIKPTQTFGHLSSFCSLLPPPSPLHQCEHSCQASTRACLFPDAAPRSPHTALASRSFAPAQAPKHAKNQKTHACNITFSTICPTRL